MRHSSFLPLLLVAACVLSPGRVSRAVDGTVEINQVRALAGGVTASDTAGYPVTLDAPGSYRLTGNLTPGSGQDGIEVLAAHVDIDLGGFQIQGDAVCTGVPASCAGGSNGVGIRSPGFVGTAVRDGTVTGMADDGLLLGPHASVRAVRAIGNGGNGISTELQGVLVLCHASSNGGAGINATDGGSLSGNTVYANAGAGILAGGSSNVFENTVSRNGGLGLSLSSWAGYARNVVDDNLGGAVAGGVDAGGNVCDGDNVCQLGGNGDFCTNSLDCMSGFYCNTGINQCEPVGQNGDGCSTGAECASGFCPGEDGVCCDTSCNGACLSCLSIKTGGSDGTCGNVLAGTDPDNECPNPQTCNGAGQCQF